MIFTPASQKPYVGQEVYFVFDSQNNGACQLGYGIFLGEAVMIQDNTSRLYVLWECVVAWTERSKLIGAGRICGLHESKLFPVDRLMKKTLDIFDQLIENYTSFDEVENWIDVGHALVGIKSAKNGEPV